LLIFRHDQSSYWSDWSKLAVTIAIYTAEPTTYTEQSTFSFRTTFSVLALLKTYRLAYLKFVNYEYKYKIP